MTRKQTQNLDVIDANAMSIRQLESLLRIDRNRISRELRKAEVPFRDGPGGARHYRLKDVLEVLFNQPKKLSPADERNLAHAEKARVETQLLKQKYIPLDELAQCNLMVMGRIREIIDETARIAPPIAERVLPLWEALLAEQFGSMQEAREAAKKFGIKLEPTGAGA